MTIAAPPDPTFYTDASRDPSPAGSSRADSTGRNTFATAVQAPPMTPPPWLPQTQWDLTTLQTRGLVDPHTSDAPYGEGGDGGGGGGAGGALKPLLLQSQELAAPGAPYSFSASSSDLMITNPFKPWLNRPDTINPAGYQFWIDSRYPLDMTLGGDRDDWKDGQSFEVVQANIGQIDFHTINVSPPNPPRSLDTFTLTAGQYAVVRANFTRTTTGAADGSWLLAWDLAPGPSVPLGAYARAVINDNPTCYYRLADAFGEDARDEMGGPAGTYIGDVNHHAGNLLPASSGQSIQINSPLASVPQPFAGVSIPDNPATRLGTAPMTVEIWINFQMEGVNLAVLDSGPAGHPVTGTPGPYRIWRNAAGTSPIFGSITTNAIPTVNPPAGNHHLVVVRESATSIITYLNGQPTPGTAAGYGNAADNGFLIGSRERWTTVTTYNMVGRLSDCAVYDHPLTQAQVQAHNRIARTGS